MHINDIVNHPHLPSIIWDFMSRVSNSQTERKCRLWIGAADRYGHFSVDDIVHSAHRVSYTIFNGPIPEGLDVLHRCDTPLCVNPEHLFIGNQADNSRDMVLKGRSHSGDKNHSAKIARDVVLSIFVATGRHAEIAVRFGVDKSTVSHIKTGRQWSSVTGMVPIPSSRARKLLPTLIAFRNRT